MKNNLNSQSIPDNHAFIGGKWVRYDECAEAGLKFAKPLTYASEHSNEHVNVIYLGTFRKWKQWIPGTGWTKEFENKKDFWAFSYARIGKVDSFPA